MRLDVIRCRRPGAICLLALALATTAACEGPMTRQEKGTYGGALLGAMAGSYFGSEGAMLLFAGGGAVAGALVGRAVGGALDDIHRDQVASGTAETIATGEPRTWTDARTGATVSTRLVGEARRTVPTPIRIEYGPLAKLPPLELVGEPRRAVERVDVRAGPGPEYRAVGFLRSGEAAWVYGRAVDTDWVLIAEEGRAAYGYVPADRLRLDPSARVDTFRGERIVVDMIVPCRTVEQVLTRADGTKEREEITACRGPDGWEVVERG